MKKYLFSAAMLCLGASTFASADTSYNSFETPSVTRETPVKSSEYATIASERAHAHFNANFSNAENAIWSCIAGRIFVIIGKRF